MLSVLVPLRLMDYSETTANATVAVAHHSLSCLSSLGLACGVSDKYSYMSSMIYVNVTQIIDLLTKFQ